MEPTHSDALLVRVMGVRRLNRLAQFHNRQQRERVIAERARVEEKHLQLQNLNHEIDHLKKEIDRCLDFVYIATRALHGMCIGGICRSADERIQLVEIDEFYANAPVAISKPEMTRNDAHAQRLARLNWEIAERKKCVCNSSRS